MGKISLLKAMETVVKINSGYYLVYSEEFHQRKNEILKKQIKKEVKI